MPADVSIVPLPAEWPELNPVENVSQFIPGNWLSSRVLLLYSAVVDHCCKAWNGITEQP